MFFLYIQDGISVFRLLSIDSRHFFLILQVTTIAEKLKKITKNIIVSFEEKKYKYELLKKV